MTPQNLLDAMDGVSLLLDRELRIQAVGWPNWNRFLDENRGRAYARDEILGKRITEFFTPGEVRDTFRHLFEQVLEGERGALRVNYHCDSPEVGRLMRLSVTRLTGEANAGLLYQSVLLEATQRPPIGLFGVPVRPPGEEDLLTICSICTQVAWPKGAPPEGREWIAPQEYYRRGGEDVTALSHGFCETCLERLLAEID